MTHKKLILMALMGVMLSDAEARLERKQKRSALSARGRGRGARGRPQMNSDNTGKPPVKMGNEGGGLFGDQDDGGNRPVKGDPDPEPKNDEIDLDQAIELPPVLMRYLSLPKDTTRRAVIQSTITGSPAGNIDTVSNALVSDFKAFAESTEKLAAYTNPIVQIAMKEVYKNPQSSLQALKAGLAVSIHAPDGIDAPDVTVGIGGRPAMGHRLRIGEAEVFDLGNFEMSKSNLEKGGRLDFKVLDTLRGAFDDMLARAKKALILVNGQEKTLGELGLDMGKDQFAFDNLNKRVKLTGTKEQWLSDEGDVISAIDGTKVLRVVLDPFKELVVKVVETIQDAAGKTKKGIHLPRLVVWGGEDASVFHADNISRLSVDGGCIYRDSQQAGGGVLRLVEVKKPDNGLLSFNANFDDPEDLQALLDGELNDDFRVSDLFSADARRLLADVAPKYHQKKSREEKGYKKLSMSMLSPESLAAISPDQKKKYETLSRRIDDFEKAKSADKEKYGHTVLAALKDLAKVQPKGLITMLKHKRMPKKVEKDENFIF